MTGTNTENRAAGLRSALAATASSTRLQAALAAGSAPSPEYVDVLIAQCRIEPDFFVRDMLTWALVRHDPAAVAARLRDELRADVPQARAQALHTLSKLQDRSTWSWITPELLADDDEEVARAAWRTAAGLVPAGGERDLALVLAAQFGRGTRDTQRSLSRALAELGPAADAAVDRGAASGVAEVRAHALATRRLIDDPEEGFDAAMAEARKAMALRGAPAMPEGE